MALNVIFSFMDGSEKLEALKAIGMDIFLIIQVFYIAWTLFIFAHESYMDEVVGGAIFNLILAGITIYWGIKIYRGKHSH